MSIYPKISSTSNVFNPNDIISYGSEDNTTSIQLDLSSFVQKDSAVFSSDVYLQGDSKLNFAGILQSSAFTEEEKATNDSNKRKLSEISYDSDNNVLVASSI